MRHGFCSIGHVNPTRASVNGVWHEGRLTEPSDVSKSLWHKDEDLAKRERCGARWSVHLGFALSHLLVPSLLRLLTLTWYVAIHLNLTTTTTKRKSNHVQCRGQCFGSKDLGWLLDLEPEVACANVLATPLLDATRLALYCASLHCM